VNRCSDYVTHYRTDAEHFDYFTNENPTTLAYERLFRKFITRLAGSHHTVVDIGSGGGWSSIIPHKNIFFVDLSTKNLSALKSETSEPVMADAHRLPFRSDSVEFVVASEIIEHLNDPATAAGEIWRILKPGGRAVVSTPYKEKLRYTLCIHCNQVTPWNAHLHSFDEKILLDYFPPGARKRAHIFGSKILAFARAPRLFSKLPIWMWRAIDLPLVKLIDKAQHVVVVIEKSPAV
jgi:SAM-dependent methyltransferase